MLRMRVGSKTKRFSESDTPDRQRALPNGEDKIHASPSSTGRVLVYESELRWISLESLTRGAVETGGELYGLNTHAGTPVILLATPPGSGAMHRREFFEQDIAFFRKVNSNLWNCFGLQFLGNWHSHHVIGLARSSSRDIDSIASMMRGNSLPSFVQIIITHEISTRAHSGQDDAEDSERIQTTDHQPFYKALAVKLSYYVYRNPSCCQSCEAKVRVLPGESPFRMTLRSSQDPFLASLASSTSPPSPGPSLVLDIATDTPSQTVPETLDSELRTVPDSVLAESDLTVDGNRAIFAARLASGVQFCIAYNLTSTTVSPMAVFVEDSKTHTFQDVSSEILLKSRNCRTLDILRVLALRDIDLANSRTQKCEETPRREKTSSEIGETKSNPQRPSSGLRYEAES